MAAGVSATPRPLRFPAYELAERRLYDAVFWAKVKSDPLLSQIRFARSEHIGPIRAISGDDPYDTRMEPHGGVLAVSLGTFLSMDFAAFIEAVANAAEQAVGSMKTMMFGHVGAISDRVGNTVDGTDKGATEALKELFMRVDVDFDDDGNPRWPTLVGPPAQREIIRNALTTLEDDAELTQRVAALRSEFLRNRPKRRLLSPC